MVQNGAKYNKGLKRWELPPGSNPTARMGVQGGEGQDSIPPLGQKKAALMKDAERKARNKARSPEEKRAEWVKSLPKDSKEFKRFLGGDFVVTSKTTNGRIEIQTRPSKSAIEQAKRAGNDPYRIYGQTGDARTYQAAAAKIIDKLYPHLQKEWIAENLKD